MKRMRLISSLAFVFAVAMCTLSCNKEELEKPGSENEIQEIQIVDPASGTLTLEQGDQKLIQFKVVPEIRQPFLEWTVDNPEIATVSGGIVTAMKPGETIVRVSGGKAEAQVALVVTPVAITSFTVPSSCTLVVGETQTLEVTVKPEKANAGCLDWKIKDEAKVSLSFEDGNAVLTGKSAGETEIKVSGGGISKTISVVVHKSFYNMVYADARHGGTFKVVEAGQKIPIESLKANVGYGKLIMFSKLDFADIDIADCQISNSVPSVCDCEVVSRKDDPSFALLVFKPGTQTGETEIRFSYQDPVRQVTFTIDFIIVYKPVFSDGDAIYFVEESRNVKSSETISGKSTARFRINSNASFPVKWSVSDQTVAELSPAGVIAEEVTIKRKNFGTATVKATDASGKVMSFSLTFQQAPFPSDCKIKSGYNRMPMSYEPYYLDARDLTSNTLNLSASSESLGDELYVAEWSIYSVDAEPCLSVTRIDDVTAKLTIRNTGSATLIAKDIQGNELQQYMVVVNNVKGLALSFQDELGEYDNPHIRSQKIMHVLWKGTNTNITRRFRLIDEQGHIYDPSNLSAELYIRNSYPEATYPHELNDQKYISFDLSTQGYGTFYWKTRAGQCVVRVSDPFGNHVDRTLVSDFLWSDWDLYEYFQGDNHLMSTNKVNDSWKSLSMEQIGVYGLYLVHSSDNSDDAEAKLDPILPGNNWDGSTYRNHYDILGSVLTSYWKDHECPFYNLKVSGDDRKIVRYKIKDMNGTLREYQISYK